MVSLFISFHSYLLGVKQFKLFVVTPFYDLCNVKCYSLYSLLWDLMSNWLFIGALKRFRGFASCCFICWEPYILFKATFLRVLFCVQMMGGGKNKAFWFGTLLKRCHAFVRFLQRVLCTGWPSTCAMTDIQYLNVFGLAGHTGFIELHTVWSLMGWTHVWEVLWGVINASSHYRETCSLFFILFSVYTYKYFEGLTSFTAQWLASVFCYCIVTVKICLLND